MSAVSRSPYLFLFFWGKAFEKKLDCCLMVKVTLMFQGCRWGRDTRHLHKLLSVISAREDILAGLEANKQDFHDTTARDLWHCWEMQSLSLGWNGWGGCCRSIRAEMAVGVHSSSHESKPGDACTLPALPDQVQKGRREHSNASLPSERPWQGSKNTKTEEIWLRCNEFAALFAALILWGQCSVFPPVKASYFAPRQQLYTSIWWEENAASGGHKGACSLPWICCMGLRLRGC